MIVNKMDILQQPEERQQMLDFVSQQVAKILGGVQSTPIFPVSGRQALASKLANPGSDPALGPGARLWEESQVSN